MLRRNGLVMKSEAGRESMVEKFVKEVGLEAGVKERGSYGWEEMW